MVKMVTKRRVYVIAVLCGILWGNISIGISGNAPDQTVGCREGQDCVQLPNPLSSTDIPFIIGNVVKAAMGIVGTITLVIFLYAGFLWLTSAGNSEKIQQGLQGMLWAGIGIIVIFSSYAILTLILKTLQATQ